MPLIVRWPDRVKAGSTSSQLVCLVDVMGTVAEMVGAKLPENAAEDSISFLPAMLGQTGRPARTTLISHSINGSFAIREDWWKLCLCAGSGGWSAPRPGADDANLPPNQLFDLRTDIEETTNLQSQHPEIVARLTKLLEQQVADGRSTPGERQANAVLVKINKDR